MSLSDPAPTDALLATALRAHQDGDLGRAETLYLKVLDAAPRHARALQYMGLLYEHRGDLDEAAQVYDRALEVEPANVGILNRLATVRGRQGDYDAAEAQARAALEFRPDFAPAWTTLGNVFEACGRLTEATEAFRKGLDFAPEDPNIHNNLGIALARQGLVEEAERHYRRALELAPDSVDFLNNLGSLLSRQGQYAAALDVFHRAVDLAPDDAPLLINLGDALAEIGELKTAQDLFTRALAIAPEDRTARLGLVTTLARGELSRYQPAIDRLLTTVHGWPDIGLASLVPLTAKHLRLKYRLPDTAIDMCAVEIDDDLLTRLAGDRLLVAYLAATINADPALEIFLTTLRRRLAEANIDAEGPTFVLAAAMARQCAINEYAFATGDDEAAWTAEWRRDLETVTDWQTPTAQAHLVRYGLYASPSELANREGLAALAVDAWLPPLRPWLKEELHDRARDATLAAALPALTPIDDPTSRRVAAQYEANPYPRWTSLSRQRPESPAAILRDLFPHFEPPDFLRGPVDVLIAGGGTGQHPIAEAALVYKDSRVLAIDLSRASLGYAARRARDLGVDNLDFAVADILELGSLERRFDVVEAAGVVHHLADPEAGWRVLASLVRPGGVMMVALYSRRSRRHIAAAREALGTAGAETDAAALRDFRQRVMLDPAYKAYRGLLDSTDFYSLSGCRDLAFHAQEHTFSLPEIGTMLDRLGLRLIGLQHADPSVPRRYRSNFPDDTTQTDLAGWDAFEERNPKAFAGMYHVWCHKPAS